MHEADDVASQAVNILVVDDREENTLLLEGLLEQPGRAIHRASSGDRALALLREHEFAVVLLDVEMPGMDGYETARRIHAEGTRLVPIIFVTAGARSDDRMARGYAVGAVDFLYKPINAHILDSKVAVFTELHRKSRALAELNAELARTAATLAERVADLENVSQTLAHDLRAPLRTIRRFSDELGESLRGTLSAEDADALDRVVRGGARMSAMIDSLYALLKLSTDDAAHAEIDSASVLRDTLDNLRADIETLHATVTHEPLPRVRGNRMLVSQIFQNLIANSLRFRGARPPEVHITAVPTPDAWQFEVRDNGIGIGVEDRERVFRLFERVSAANPGSGVGLALCKRAVEKLGGRISISGEPALGTAFLFTIPRHV